MIDVPLAYAFTAGLVAVVNPCGFPMLPAYLSWFIGLDDEEGDATTRVPRALLSAGAVSVGFLAVFGGLGIPINAGFSSIYQWMPWLTIVIGLALAGLGVAMLGGYRLMLMLPHLDRGGRSRNVGSMVLFGVSYAIASLGCTLPIFLVYVAGTAERSNLLSGLVAFVAYGAGITVVLMTVSLALALARESVVRRMKAALQYMDRVAGVLLVVVGVYLVYYGIETTGSDTPATNSPVGVVDDWSARASAWLQDGGVELGVGLAAVVVAVALWAAVRRRRSTSATPAPDEVRVG
jgi:cytochrome c-type biogenesis protein